MTEQQEKSIKAGALLWCEDSYHGLNLTEMLLHLLGMKRHPENETGYNETKMPKFWMMAKNTAKPLCVLAIVLGENLSAPPQEANGVVISPGLAGEDSHVPLGCGYTLCGHIINYQLLSIIKTHPIKQFPATSRKSGQLSMRMLSWPDFLPATHDIQDVCCFIQVSYQMAQLTPSFFSGKSIEQLLMGDMTKQEWNWPGTFFEYEWTTRILVLKRES